MYLSKGLNIIVDIFQDYDLVVSSDDDDYSLSYDTDNNYSVSNDTEHTYYPCSDCSWCRQRSSTYDSDTESIYENLTEYSEVE